MGLSSWEVIPSVERSIGALAPPELSHFVKEGYMSLQLQSVTEILDRLSTPDTQPSPVHIALRRSVRQNPNRKERILANTYFDPVSGHPTIEFGVEDIFVTVRRLKDKADEKQYSNAEDLFRWVSAHELQHIADMMNPGLLAQERTYRQLEKSEAVKSKRTSVAKFKIGPIAVSFIGGRELPSPDEALEEYHKNLAYNSPFEKRAQETQKRWQELPRIVKFE